MVRVLYVDNQVFDSTTGGYIASSESTIQAIEIDGDGDFVDPWPGGFFEDRLLELPMWDDEVTRRIPVQVEDDGLF